MHSALNGCDDIIVIITRKGYKNIITCGSVAVYAKTSSVSETSAHTAALRSITVMSCRSFESSLATEYHMRHAPATIILISQYESFRRLYKI